MERIGGNLAYIIWRIDASNDISKMRDPRARSLSLLFIPISFVIFLTIVVTFSRNLLAKIVAKRSVMSSSCANGESEIGKIDRRFAMYTARFDISIVWRTIVPKFKLRLRDTDVESHDALQRKSYLAEGDTKTKTKFI